MDVATTPVATGLGTVDHARVFENVEVVRYQIGLDAHQLPQFDRRTIRDSKFVDEGEAQRVTQCRKDGGSSTEARVAHTLTI